MRIYFDKQIFSHLFKQEKAEYINLLKKLYEFKENGLFCYSHAHLLDLKNDKTDIKYRELDFIETLVDDNYLSYHAINKYTSCYLAKPNQAFADVDIVEDKLDFSKIFDFDDSFLSFEDREKFNSAKKILTDFKFDLSIFQNDLTNPEIDDSLKKILPFKNTEVSFIEMMENMMGSLKTLEEDKTAYKGLRNISEKYINNGKFSIEYDNIDFNNDLKNSVLQKTFIEYVKSNLNPNP